MDMLLFLRQFRIGPYTIFDTAISYLGIYILAPYLTRLVSNIHLHISRTDWLWLTLPLSVMFHAIFRQNTPIMQRLFDPTTYYIETIILLCMTYIGLHHVHTPIKK